MSDKETTVKLNQDPNIVRKQVVKHVEALRGKGSFAKLLSALRESGSEGSVAAAWDRIYFINDIFHGCQTSGSTENAGLEK
jgi:hypothetical protein